jgi:hypothetical protein
MANLPDQGSISVSRICACQTVKVPSEAGLGGYRRKMIYFRPCGGGFIGESSWLHSDPLSVGVTMRGLLVRPW